MTLKFRPGVLPLRHGLPGLLHCVHFRSQLCECTLLEIFTRLVQGLVSQMKDDSARAHIHFDWELEGVVVEGRSLRQDALPS